MKTDQERRVEKETYESLVKQHAIGDELAIPSIKDALPFLKIFEGIDFESIISEQLMEIKTKAHDFSGATLVAKKAITFLIPLTSYLPLPKPYTAAAIDGRKLKKKQVCHFTCVRIEDYLPRLTEKNGVLIKLSYAVVTVCDTEFGFINPKIEKNENLLEIYERAVQALNKVIDSYKATPMRHNHLLQPTTILGSPGQTYVAISSIKHNNILSQGEIELHGHLFGEIFAARAMTSDELAIFQEIHLRNSFDDDYPLRMVRKLNEAIDASCVGRNEAAVLLADLYAEQSMSYWLYRILLEKGLKEDEAQKGSRNFKEVTKLKNKLALELGFKQSDFDKLIKYNRWYQLCREKRNGLTHDFLYTTVNGNRISYDAVQESASLIKRIAEESAQKYPNLYNDGRIFWASTWMLDSIKHQPQGK